MEWALEAWEWMEEEARKQMATWPQSEREEFLKTQKAAWLVQAAQAEAKRGIKQ